jgi:hypothetical protein
MANSIKPFEVIEGNLKAEKDTGDFGGPNMWRLHVKTIRGTWQNIQWLNHYAIQALFKTSLPEYIEEKRAKYKLA